MEITDGLSEGLILMAKYFRRVQIVDAFQWFPGVGHDIQDVYPSGDGKTAVVYHGHDQEIVEPGDWCVRGADLQVMVYTSDEFHELYDEVFPGYKGQA